MIPVKVDEIMLQQDQIELSKMLSLVNLFCREGIDCASNPIICLVKRADYEAAVTNGDHSLLTIHVSRILNNCVHYQYTIRMADIE